MADEENIQHPIDTSIKRKRSRHWDLEEYIYKILCVLSKYVVWEYCTVR